MPTATRGRKLTAEHPIERRFPIITSLPDSKIRAYRKRVERGAQDLDELQPGWWRHIRLTRLNMATGSFRGTGCGCIAAQLAYHYDPQPAYERVTGFYDRWVDRLGLTSYSKGRYSQVAYGYILPVKDWNDDRVEEAAWNLLDQLWANEVRKRRET